ncbi:MAG TPA: DoxX family membrane protein [Acidimicrobiales bacterium]|nr:DoxX family membrane protein [Acidimicrobiales bacterium]
MVSVVLLVVRLAVGVALAVLGASRLFGRPVPRPPRRPPSLGPLMPVAQVTGGILLALGLLTPVAAAVLVGMTGVVVWRQRSLPGAPIPLDDPERLAVTVAGPVGLVVAFTGAGRLSVDHALGFADGGVVRGMVSLALGLVGATAVVGGRDRLTDPHGGVTGDE